MVTLTSPVYSYADSKVIMQLTDRDQNLTKEQRDRQKDNLREVLRFCSNKTDCRRSQVLAFFNETFDPKNCNQGCDVCSSRDQQQITVKDVTEDAVRVIKMMKAFQRDDKITILNAVDCFRGTNGNSAKGLGQNPHFACGKDWDRGEAERLVQNLLIERALDEFYSANGAGWTNSYIRVSRAACLVFWLTTQPGPQAQRFLNGTKTLKMDFRAASPRKSRGKGGKAAAGDLANGGQARLVPLAQRKTAKSTTALSRKRSRQEMLEDEQDFVASDGDDDYEPIEDDSDDRIESDFRSDERVMAIPAPTTKRPRKSAPLASQMSSASELCLEALRALREKVRPRLLTGLTGAEVDYAGRQHAADDRSYDACQ